MIIVKENWFYRSLSPLGPSPPPSSLCRYFDPSGEGRSPGESSASAHQK
jgi:hypothetical protein